jgi:hypothetical protein
MINNTKVNRYVTKKNFPAALTISLLLILASNVTNTPLFELAYAIKEFNIDVDIEDNEIKRGDTQHITVTVSNEDTDNRVSDANVKLIVYPPDSDSTSAHDKTDNNGKATFDVEIDDNAETGTYDAEIKVSKDGYDTKSVNTSFDVVKSGGTDNEDDENGITMVLHHLHHHLLQRHQLQLLLHKTATVIMAQHQVQVLPIIGVVMEVVVHLHHLHHQQQL